MKLTIIIVSWNTRELLSQCLTSIYRSPPSPEFEVWVVDNASEDGSIESIRRDFPAVRLISNSQNLGFAYANNQAVRSSTGEYLLLLNPDTEVHPLALQRLIDFLDQKPDHGAVGPRTLNPDGSLQTSSYPIPTLFREFWRMFYLDRVIPIGTYPMHIWDLKKPREVDALLGACLMVRRRALDEVGLLDDQYFMYSEEIDLCFRLRQAGWKISWVPEAQIVHYGGQSTQQVADAMFLNLYRSKIHFFRKHYGNRRAWAYKQILYAAALARVMARPFFRGESRRRLGEQYCALIVELPSM